MVYKNGPSFNMEMLDVGTWPHRRKVQRNHGFHPTGWNSGLSNVKCGFNGFNVQKSQHEIPRPTVPAILALDHLAPVMARSYLILALRGAWEQPAVQRSRDERWIWFRGEFILQQIHSFPHVLGMEPNNVPISEIEIDWNHLLHGMDPRMRITELVIYRRSNSEVAEKILPHTREAWKMDYCELFVSLSFSIWLATWK